MNTKRSFSEGKSSEKSITSARSSPVKIYQGNFASIEILGKNNT